MDLIRHHAVEEHLGYIVSIISIIVLTDEGQKKVVLIYSQTGRQERKGSIFIKR